MGPVGNFKEKNLLVAFSICYRKIQFGVTQYKKIESNMNKFIGNFLVAAFLVTFAADTFSAIFFDPEYDYLKSSSSMVPASTSSLMQEGDGVILGSLGFNLKKSATDKEQQLLNRINIKLTFMRVDDPTKEKFEFSVQNIPDEYKASSDKWAVPSISRLSDRDYRSLFYRSLHPGTYKVTGFTCRFQVDSWIYKCWIISPPDLSIEIKPGQVTYAGAYLLDTDFLKDRDSNFFRKVFLGIQYKFSFLFADDFKDDLRQLRHVRKEMRTVDASDARAGSQNEDILLNLKDGG